MQGGTQKRSARVVLASERCQFRVRK